jgi:hypothetical protein
LEANEEKIKLSKRLEGNKKERKIKSNTKRGKERQREGERRREGEGERRRERVRERGRERAVEFFVSISNLYDKETINYLFCGNLGGYP